MKSPKTTEPANTAGIVSPSKTQGPPSVLPISKVQSKCIEELRQPPASASRTPPRHVAGAGARPPRSMPGGGAPARGRRLPRVGGGRRAAPIAGGPGRNRGEEKPPSQSSLSSELPRWRPRLGPPASRCANQAELRAEEPLLCRLIVNNSSENWKSGPVPWVPGGGFSLVSGKAQPFTPRSASTRFFSCLGDRAACAVSSLSSRCPPTAQTLLTTTFSYLNMHT